MIYIQDSSSVNITFEKFSFIGMKPKWHLIIVVDNEKVDSCRLSQWTMCQNKELKYILLVIKRHRTHQLSKQKLDFVLCIFWTFWWCTCESRWLDDSYSSAPISSKTSCVAKWHSLHFFSSLSRSSSFLRPAVSLSPSSSLVSFFPRHSSC